MFEKKVQEVPSSSNLALGITLMLCYLTLLLCTMVSFSSFFVFRLVFDPRLSHTVSWWSPACRGEVATLTSEVFDQEQLQAGVCSWRYTVLP